MPTFKFSSSSQSSIALLETRQPIIIMKDESENFTVD